MNLVSAYIMSIKLNNKKRGDAYPFTMNAIKNLDELHFSAPITFFIGDNGSGKSTLLEGIAAAYGFNPEGGSKNFSFSTSDTHSSLSDHLILAKGFRKAKDGYFLRAESFYNVATEIDELNKDYFSPPLLPAYGGVSLHELSHGESFTALINNRFSGHGLYLLDEPEAALSPIAQIAALKRMHELVNKESQFIIATHSPILLAYPYAEIFQFTSDGIQKVNYQDTMFYALYKRIINDPAYIKEFIEET